MSSRPVDYSKADEVLIAILPQLHPLDRVQAARIMTRIAVNLVRKWGNHSETAADWLEELCQSARAEYQDDMAHIEYLIEMDALKHGGNR